MAVLTGPDVWPTEGVMAPHPPSELLFLLKDNLERKRELLIEATDIPERNAVWRPPADEAWLIFGGELRGPMEDLHFRVGERFHQRIWSNLLVYVPPRRRCFIQAHHGYNAPDDLVLRARIRIWGWRVKPVEGYAGFV